MDPNRHGGKLRHEQRPHFGYREREAGSGADYTSDNRARFRDHDVQALEGFVERMSMGEAWEPNRSSSKIDTAVPYLSTPFFYWGTTES